MVVDEDSEIDVNLNTIEKLQEEIKKPITPIKKTEEMTLKEMCMLCLERKSDAVLMNCGHSKLCFFCAFKVYRTQGQCHLCRQDI